MKPRRVVAIARKEFLHIVRDPRSLGMAIAIPMLMLVLFGYALTMDVDNVPMVVWDQSGTHASREFVSRFDLSPYFSLVGHVASPREIDEALNRRRAIVAMVLPSDFAKRLETGRSAPVQLIVDGTDSNTATIALGYAEAIARTYGQEVGLAELRRLGGPPQRPPRDIRPRVWLKAGKESNN
jgi:ABC-2 type transport system permease protein